MKNSPHQAENLCIETYLLHILLFLGWMGPPSPPPRLRFWTPQGTGEAEPPTPPPPPPQKKRKPPPLGLRTLGHVCPACSLYGIFVYTPDGRRGFIATGGRPSVGKCCSSKTSADSRFFSFSVGGKHRRDCATKQCCVVCQNQNIIPLSMYVSTVPM